jgi:hypothetical protein
MPRLKTLPSGLPPEKLQQLQTLIARAEHGDRTVLPELQEALDEHPCLWQSYGDLALRAEAIWLQMLAPDDLMSAETAERKMESLRAELAGPAPSPLERLLVERVVACWLHVYVADQAVALAWRGAGTPATRQAFDRRQDGAQHRYLQALKTLALVRRLLRPTPAPQQLTGHFRSPSGAAAFRRRNALPATAAGVCN